MKRYMLILSGLLLLATMLGLLFFAGAIYDAESKYNIETFFFQKQDKAENRINTPISPDDLSNTVLRNMIIERFLNEYFYVIPDVKNAEMRKDFMNTDKTKTALYGLSYSNPRISKNWAENVAPQIIELAQNHALRIVRLVNVSESEGGYLIVKYELTTWDKPNDVLAIPTVTTGELYLSVSREPVRVLQTADALNRLVNGVDPVSAFNFRILDVVQN